MNDWKIISHDEQLVLDEVDHLIDYHLPIREDLRVRFNEIMVRLGKPQRIYLRKEEKRMIIYIAGAITGVGNYEESFEEAERILEEQGHIVLNPALLPQGLGSCDDYMKICLPMVEIADAVVMLDGWRDSRGACREWGFATALGKKIVEFDELGFFLTSL